MAAREIECDAEITCQSDNFHRSDIQDIFFLSSYRTVVEHSSSTSSKKRPAGIRTCGCRAQWLQRAQRTSDTQANFVERHFFLLMAWYQQINPTRVSVNIPPQKKEEVAATHINLTNNLINNSQHLLLYTDGSQGKGGSNGTGMVAIHA